MNNTNQNKQAPANAEQRSVQKTDFVELAAKAREHEPYIGNMAETMLFRLIGCLGVHADDKNKVAIEALAYLEKQMKGYAEEHKIHIW